MSSLDQQIASGKLTKKDAAKIRGTARARLSMAQLHRDRWLAQLDRARATGEAAQIAQAQGYVDAAEADIARYRAILGDDATKP